MSRRRPRTPPPGFFEDACNTKKPMGFPMSFGWFFNVQKRCFLQPLGFSGVEEGFFDVAVG